MKPNNLIEQVRDLIQKVKEQDIEFGLYLEKHLILDEERGVVYYFGKKLTQVEHLPIIVDG